MRVTVIGSGYVGLVTGACLSDLGFRVVCLDKDIEKVQLLQRGDVPIYEPGLKELLARNHAEGRIRFTDNAEEAIEHGDILFIAVGTPAQEDGSADLGHVLSVASMIGNHLNDFKLIVNKSTVPVGTADRGRTAVKQQLM
ncbi:MAG: FAD-dependent monooxygenase, partial [Polynucleobacter victoriensis]